MEALVYKSLIENGICPDYEKVTYTLFNGFKPRFPLLCIKDKHLYFDKKRLLPITYTPDFTFIYKDLYVILEVKGFPNDVFPYKFKMFRQLLENIAKNDTSRKYILAEIFNTAQLKEFISLLNAYDPMTLNVNLNDVEFCVEDIKTKNRIYSLYKSKDYENMEIVLRRYQRALAKSIKDSGGNSWKDERYTKLHEIINSISIFTVREQLLTADPDSLNDSYE